MPPFSDSLSRQGSFWKSAERAVAAPPENSGGGSRLLLVNDNATQLVALKVALETPGVEIVTVTSGREALRELLRQSFDLIVLDVNMPELDGFQTAALIRKRPVLDDVPFLFVTATQADPSHRAFGLELGAVDYIYAPVASQILRSKVAALLDLRRQSKQQRRMEERDHRLEMAAVQQSLEEEIRRNRFFTLSIDLLAVANYQGQLLQVSPSWERSLGFNSQELIGRTYLELVLPVDREAASQELTRIRGGQPVEGSENRCGCKDGSIRWLLWNASPFPEQELIYMAARDITDRKQAEQALAEREARLAAANQELEAFSYTASHDLRAPLRTIRGFAEMLLEEYGGKLDETAQRHLERIGSAACNMSQLIEDLLTLSRVSKHELRREVLDLARMAQAVSGELQEREPERRVELAIPDRIPARGDARLVRIVLDNLFGNAWKFSSKNPEARIELQVSERAGERVYAVRDNGVGFDNEKAKNIFGAFCRLHTAEEFPGTGIGLATVSRIIQRHRGRVWAEGTPGQGATIAFTLGEEDCSEPEAEGGAEPGSGEAR